MLLHSALMFYRLLLLLMAVHPHLSGHDGDASRLSITPPVIGRA